MIMPQTTKHCNQCGADKTLDQFYWNRSKNRLVSVCKDCNKVNNNTQARKYKDGHSSGLLHLPASKVCHDCGQEKPASEFNRRRASKDGLTAYCKRCWIARRKLVDQKTKDRNRERERRTGTIVSVETKECSTCHEVKLSAQFYTCMHSPDGLHHNCRKCQRAYGARKARENREKNVEAWKSGALHAGTKRCPKCSRELPVISFYFSSYSYDGLSSLCRDCNVDRARRRREQDPVASSTATRRKRLMTEYGLTLDDYDAMLDAQGGACAVCGGPPVGHSSHLDVDHDHDTGLVRGLLCNHCNASLGHAGDDPERLEQLAAYLRHYEYTKNRSTSAA